MTNFSACVMFVSFLRTDFSYLIIESLSGNSNINFEPPAVGGFNELKSSPFLREQMRMFMGKHLVYTHTGVAIDVYKEHIYGFVSLYK